MARSRMKYNRYSPEGQEVLEYGEKYNSVECDVIERNKLHRGVNAGQS